MATRGALRGRTVESRGSRAPKAAIFRGARYGCPPYHNRGARAWERLFPLAFPRGLLRAGDAGFRGGAVELFGVRWFGGGGFAIGLLSL